MLTTWDGSSGYAEVTEMSWSDTITHFQTIGPVLKTTCWLTGGRCRSSRTGVICWAMLEWRAVCHVGIGQIYLFKLTIVGSSCIAMFLSGICWQTAVLWRVSSMDVGCDWNWVHGSCRPVMFKIWIHWYCWYVPLIHWWKVVNLVCVVCHRNLLIFNMWH